MIKNLILVSAVSVSFVACGGGGSGGGGGKGAGKGSVATCDQVLTANAAINSNGCEAIFEQLAGGSYFAVDLQKAEVCYQNAKIIQSAAGKTCKNPETGEQEELINANEFAAMMKPVDEGMKKLREYHGVSAPAEDSSSVPAQTYNPQPTSANNCAQAEAVYNEQDGLNCEALENGVNVSELQSRSEQQQAYNILKPCVANLERLQAFAGLSCGDFEVPSKSEFDQFLPDLKESLRSLEEILN